MNTLEDRERIRQLNAEAMGRVLVETSISIRPDALSKWRPTRRVRGTIRGVVGEVWCLATDGILGVFVFDGGNAHGALGKAFLGHVMCFEWTATDMAEPFKDEETGETTYHVTITGVGAPPTLYGGGGTTTKKQNMLASKNKKMTKAAFIKMLLE